MATVTRLVTTPDSGNTPNTSGAFTPAQDDLLIAVIVGSVSVADTDDVPTASANGITFATLASGAAVQAVYNGSANSVVISVAEQLVGASPASMTVTWGPTDGATSTVIDVYAVRSSGGRSGTQAVRQVDNTDNGTASGTPSIAFPQAVLTGDVTLVAVANISAPANVEQPTDWTEVNDTNCTTPTAGLEVAARTSGFTGTTVTWAGTSATNWGAVGVEIDTSAPVVNATMTTLVGDAAAAGSASGAIQGGATFSATTSGNASAAGGEGTITGGADATFAATTGGDAAAAGGTGSITGEAGSTNADLTTLVGDAAAAGGDGALRSDATFGTATGDATAGGGISKIVLGTSATGGSASGACWVDPSNATGSPNDTYATWTSVTPAETSCELVVAGFGTWADIPAGSTIESVEIRVQHHESDTGAPLEFVSAQAYLGSTPLGTATNLTLSLTDRDDTLTPSLTLAELQGNTLAVRIIGDRV